mmetsp:Transcript_10603/g.26553  ORF Transcript_10603/g.26553 Transcript_10603/m.26553 type:complete len:470 (+) Transcript_10603:79-1488(+)
MACPVRSRAPAAAGAVIVVCFFLALSACSGQETCETYNDQVATVADGLCVSLFAEKRGGGLQQPRGLISSPLTGGDLLVADLGEPGFAQRTFKRRDGENGRVLAFRDANGNGKIDDSGDEWTVLARQKGLNHGLAVHNGFLFASTSDEVYRWPYEPGTWEDLGQGERVIYNMDMTGDPGPGGGLSSPLGHSTRTLVFDNEGRLYISVGSLGNVDGDSYRSRIRRFEGLAEASFQGPALDFTRGEIFADGLRNEVGLAWANDSRSVLFGVENGMDNLARADLGGDIHNDNPGEELNAFPVDQPGKHYGYPWCFSEFKLAHPKAEGAGAQWALEDQSVADDDYCKDVQRNVPPMHSMQAHSAPLGLAFYGSDWNSSSCEEPGALPCSYLGDAFVGFHGSWNRDEPTGHKVVRLAFDKGFTRVESEEDFLWAEKDGPKWRTGLRPVDIAFGPRGEMYVSSYKSGEILVVHST